MIGVYALGLAIFLGTIHKDISVGTTILPVITLIQALFAGRFINIEDLPKGLFPKYISIYKYSLAALSLNEFETFDVDECGRAPV